MIEVPNEARRRRVVRFGPGVGSWLDEVPALVASLASRWGLQLDGTVLSGNSAIVLPADRGVLKLYPDLGIATDEAAALQHWSSARHVVDLLEHDEGALLLARVRPGSAVPTALATDPTVLPALTELWDTPGAPDVRPERVVAGLTRSLDGLDPDLLHAWCRALAPANAVAALRGAPGSARTDALVALALRA